MQRSTLTWPVLRRRARGHNAFGSARQLVWICGLLVVMSPGLAEAERKVVILRVEGKVEATRRKHIEERLVAIARRVDPKASQVDFSFPEATQLSNCIGEFETCTRPVLEEFGVDELVVGTAEPMPNGRLSVTVHRASKDRPLQTTTFMTTNDAVDNEVDARVGPWYPTVSAKQATGGPEVSTSHGSSETARPGSADQESSVASTSTLGNSDRGGRVSRGYVVGAISGGVLAAVGLVLWSQASSTQDDIDRAPTGTASDLRRLQDLEASGRSHALWGNVAVITGVAVGATCAYLYWRERRRSPRQVAITPMVHSRGIGLTFTFGGLP